MAQYLTTNKGKPELVFQGHRYQLERTTATKSIYRCVRYYKTKCHGRVYVEGDNVEVKIDHCHSPDAQQNVVRQVMNTIKNQSTNSTAPPSLLIAESVADISLAAKGGLPSESSMKKTINRKRKSANMLPTAPSSLLELVIPDTFKTLNDNRDFLLYDNGIEAGQDRILMFSTQSNLTLLEKSDQWYCDGTFNAAPLLFSQLYTIHAINGNSTIPVVFALLANKKESTYLKMLTALKNLRPTLSPANVMTDFEKASINAIKTVFPTVTQTGCYFHFRQAIYKKIQQFGLSDNYSSDESFALELRKLSALAFVPPDDVIAAYDYLLSTFFFNEEIIEPILSYFEKTWVGQKHTGNRRRQPLFPITLWNQQANVLNGLSKTNNVVESWHNSFNQILGSSHPSIWKLMQDHQKQQHLNDLRVQMVLRGETQKKKKKV